MKRNKYKQKEYKNKFGNSRVGNTYPANKTHKHSCACTKCSYKEVQRNYFKFSVTELVLYLCLIFPAVNKPERNCKFTDLQKLFSF